ncbi:chemotaxis protein CheW [Oceanobacillus sp. 1P07AA]|uniref:chemotaxis protein CheW n=1 Tax=Oceanobacillus sp. 1P07AA TaxID=3132293 RepID=UPI0039A5A67A
MEQGTIKSIKMIVFDLDGEEYALPVEWIGSIESMMPITRIPHKEDYVKGVINLRGVVIPVIDLRLRLERTKTDINENKRIIISRVEDQEVGLIVDEANDVIDIPENIIEDAPEVIDSVKPEYISGVAKIEDRLLILLDMHQILSLNSEDSTWLDEDE